MSIYTTIQKVYTERMKYKVRHKEVILLKNTCFLGVIQQDINNALCFIVWLGVETPIKSRSLSVDHRRSRSEMKER